MLGFRMDPVEKLEGTHIELKKLWDVYTTNPIFGVQFNFESDSPSLEQLLQPRVEEDTELVEDEEDVHAVAAYYADSGGGGGGREGGEGEDARGLARDGIVYDPRLGLAVESMQEGMTIESLWRVV